MEFLKGFYCAQVCKWIFVSGRFEDEYSKQRLGIQSFWPLSLTSEYLHWAHIALTAPVSGSIPYLLLYFTTGEWLMSQL